MNENPFNLETDKDVWAYANIYLNDSGMVDGSAYTHTFKDGYDVQIGVFSYTYDGTKVNHVPNVVITDKSGSIVAEPYAHDSNDPYRAIQNAKQAAEEVFTNPTRFVGE